VVSRLLQANADVQLRSNDTRTALMLAAINDNLDVVKLLVDHGANPLRKDRNGSNAVDLASQANHEEVSNYLEEASESSSIF